MSIIKNQFNTSITRAVNENDTLMNTAKLKFFEDKMKRNNKFITNNDIFSNPVFQDIENIRVNPKKSSIEDFVNKRQRFKDNFLVFTTFMIFSN